MKITQSENGYIIETDKGRLEVSTGEIYEIARFCERNDAFEEIDNYLYGFDNEECEEYFGVSLDTIQSNKDLMDCIINKYKPI